MRPTRHLSSHHRLTCRSWLVLAFVAFLLRAFVPSGYMLQASGPDGMLTMILCPSGGLVIPMHQASAQMPSHHASGHAAEHSMHTAEQSMHAAAHSMHAADAGSVMVASTAHGDTGLDAVPVEPAHASHDTEAASADCAFGALAMQIVFPDLGDVVPARVVRSSDLTFVVYATAPPLPPAGPPLGSRAPPAHLV